MLSLLTEIEDKKILDKMFDILLKDKMSETLESVTIACIIDNAEELFGTKIVDLCYLCKKPAKFKKAKNHHSYSDCCEFDMERRFKRDYVQNEIIIMCQKDNPLKEITDYIIRNLK